MLDLVLKQAEKAGAEEVGKVNLVNWEGVRGCRRMRPVLLRFSE